MIAIKQAIAATLIYTAVLSAGVYKLNALDIMIRNAVSIISKRIIFIGGLNLKVSALLYEQGSVTLFGWKGERVSMSDRLNVAIVKFLTSRHFHLQTFSPSHLFPFAG